MTASPKFTHEPYLTDISDDVARLQVGLTRFPWEGDRVQRWLRAAEARYSATNPDPLFQPPWERWQDLPNEILIALANALESAK